MKSRSSLNAEDVDNDENMIDCIERRQMLVNTVKVKDEEIK